MEEMWRCQDSAGTGRCLCSIATCGQLPFFGGRKECESLIQIHKKSLFFEQKEGEAEASNGVCEMWKKTTRTTTWRYKANVNVQSRCVNTPKHKPGVWSKSLLGRHDLVRRMGRFGAETVRVGHGKHWDPIDEYQCKPQKGDTTSNNPAKVGASPRVRHLVSQCSDGATNEAAEATAHCGSNGLPTPEPLAT